MKTSSKTNWGHLAKVEGQDIDTSDIPEFGDDFFHNAELGVLVKKPLTLRLDNDLLEWFKTGGKDYQTQINSCCLSVWKLSILNPRLISFRC